MKIGIDCRMLGSGFGLARYIQQLVKHLLEIDLENQYVLFFRNENIKEFKAVTNKNVKIIIADLPWYSWQEQIKFKKIIKQQNIDLMHFPHWNVPYVYNGPFVVTIHDLIMYHFPRPEATTLGTSKFFVKDKIHRLILRHAVKRAKHILTPTSFTKHDIHTTLKIPEEKITITYEAPFCISEEGKLNPLDVLEKYQILKPHVIYVGAAYPHKNLKGLLKAWQIFEQRYGLDYQLVLVGQKNYFYDKLINSDEIKACKQVVYTGFVPDNVLQILLRRK